LYQGIQQLMGHHNTGFGGNLGTNAPMAGSDSNDGALTNDEVANSLDDDSDNSLAMDDGGFDSSDSA
jgi:hypothetical protein